MRVAALWLPGTGYREACPPGVDPVQFGRALIEDVTDVLATLAGVDTAIVAGSSAMEDARAVAMPGTPVIEVSTMHSAIAELARRGYAEVVFFAPDAPDLPALLAAKPFSGLSASDAAVVPERDHGLVALATRLPPPRWLPAGLHLDIPGGVQRLRAAAPTPGDLAIAPAWHRLRVPADLATLDPGLEGWEATRALLSGR
jgi:hypothetical protein